MNVQAPLQSVSVDSELKKVCPTKWSSFYSSMDEVLNLFQSFPIRTEPKTDRDSFNEKEKQAKYLTAPRLLRKQVCNNKYYGLKNYH